MMKLKLLFFGLAALALVSCNNPNMPMDKPEMLLRSVTKWKVDPESETKLAMIFTKEYDKSGNLTEQVDYDKGLVISISNYTYSKEAVIEQKQTFSDGALKEEVQINYSYNNGRLVKQEKFDKMGVLKVETTFTYDNAGNLVKKQMRDVETGKVSETNYRYTINENGQIKERSVFGDSSAYQSKEEFKYDAKNNKLDVYTYGETSDYTKITSYLYDLNGNITKEIVTDKNGAIIEKFIYEYVWF